MQTDQDNSTTFSSAGARAGVSRRGWSDMAQAAGTGVGKPRLKSLSFEAWQRDLALVTLPALAVFAFCALLPGLLGDGDTNWHVAAGQWILQHRQVPFVDPFSYTAVGRPWTAHEWFAEVLFALAYGAAGWSGVSLLTAAAAAAATGAVAWELRRRLASVSVLAALVLSFSALTPVLMARPHVLALPVLALWTVGMLQARREDRRPTWLLLPVMLIWANLHASYIFGLGIAGAFAVEAFVYATPGRRMGAAIDWGVFLAAAAAASLATPHGIEGWLFPFKLVSMKTLSSITEWRSLDFASFPSIEISLVGTLFVCLYRGVRVAPVRLALLLLLLHMALHQVRHVSLLAVLAPLLLADGLGDALEPGARPARAQIRPASREVAVAIVITAALFALVAVMRLAQPMARVDSEHVPVSALAATPAGLAAQPVFNDYAFGGWLIFKGVRPFIDGRADMYGDDFVGRYGTIEHGDATAFDRAMRQYGFRWTILTPDSRLVKLLDARRDWRRLYADKYAVVHVYAPGGRGSPTAARP